MVKLKYFHLDETFEELQNNFMTKHYQEFDDVEENKLEYMKIFKEYVSVNLKLDSATKTPNSPMFY